MGVGALGKLRETVTEAADSLASTTRATLTVVAALAAAALVVALIALTVAVRRPRLV